MRGAWRELTCTFRSGRQRPVVGRCGKRLRRSVAGIPRHVANCDRDRRCSGSRAPVPLQSATIRQHQTSASRLPPPASRLPASQRTPCLPRSAWSREERERSSAHSQQEQELELEPQDVVRARPWGTLLAGPPRGQVSRLRQVSGWMVHVPAGQLSASRGVGIDGNELH